MSAEEPTPTQPDTARRFWQRSWFIRGLVVLYIAVCSLMGISFLFVSSLEVAAFVEIYGHPNALRGQPFHLRVLAQNNNPPGPLEDAREA